MQFADIQRLQHIFEYCLGIEKTIARYGDSFEAFEADSDYQRSVAFCILQIGELCNGLTDDYKKTTSDEME